ncbi:MAG: FKBP-type peptidyl-prolyl cis-trans isomerase [Verrucomicrobiae bacterium]|nr:FKBP-type peptidyl-prolyl cis-trans isomerase [Verrucomicrobiae bacterium]
MRPSSLRSILIAALSLSSAPLLPCAHGQDDAAKSESAPVPDSLESRFGYAYGFQIGKQLQRSGLSIDLEQFNRALKEALDGKDSAMTDAEVQAAFNDVQKKSEELKATAGKAFLEENGKKEGVKTTDSGLQYLVIQEGSGESPSAEDVVKVHYRGSLIDGTEFDSSYSRNEPASFPLNRVIPAWTEGLQLMKTGAKYRFFVPYQLGYGEQGSPPDIPPYSTLIFDVELLGVGGE